MKDTTRYIFDELLARFPALEATREALLEGYHLLYKCAASGGTILVCGNGGSAADAEHIAGELMKGFLLRREPTAVQREALSRLYPEVGDYLADNLQQGIRCISLVSHSALLTAYVNDVAADMAYAQQVFGYGRPGDVLLGITTSGTSRNVLNALMVARAQGMGSLLLMGRRNGEAARLCDVAIQVPETETFKVQELHLPIYHALCAMLENEIFGQ